MRTLNKRVFAMLAWAVICLGLSATQVLAANGKIAGVVKDKSTGEAIPGANVTTDVGGTTIGATTDVDGRYFLLNLPPGTYMVKVTFVGYQQKPSGIWMGIWDGLGRKNQRGTLSVEAAGPKKLPSSFISWPQTRRVLLREVSTWLTGA